MKEYKIYREDEDGKEEIRIRELLQVVKGEDPEWAFVFGAELFREGKFTTRFAKYSIDYNVDLAVEIDL